ncbi:hypothetical protein [Paenirhodobacter sp. CAU 1674]|uniref:lipopolysaccharide biosynthesis protein n=1 Tax=Paenirhodobacter sp. CAU 1674 TaxID=3032596 RepID=UPI0023DACFFC|nr:hypothetical protein [Paenirhodobacter sp. CAU 1674]MDF2142042.1 hypothetical protein [Paenirhodobacter sp. CAU 1674]
MVPMTDLLASPVARRLLGGFGANLLGKVWAMAIQLISVPVLTKAWGLDGFGIWRMISTIPAYLALSDFGLGTAAGIDITRSVAREDRPEALRAFQTVWLFLTAVTCGVAILVGLGLAIWLELAGASAAAGPSRGDIAITAIFVTLGALFGAQMSIRKVVYQATHKYALGTALNDLGFLAQGIVVIAVALSGGGIVAAAVAGAVATGAMLVIYARVLARLEPWCRIGFAASDRATLRRLLHPSLAAFALTAANSFGLQGVVLTIGWTMGPAVAAVFATARLMSRIPLQFSSLLTRASLPELTRALVAGNAQLVARLMRLNLALTAAVMVPAAAALALWGPQLLARLSGGEMQAGWLVLALLGLAALANGVWTTLGTRLLAMNRQSDYAWLVLGLYALVALSPFVAGGRLEFVAFVAAVVEVVVAAQIWIKQ